MYVNGIIVQTRNCACAKLECLLFLKVACTLFLITSNIYSKISQLGDFIHFFSLLDNDNALNFRIHYIVKRIVRIRLLVENNDKKQVINHFPLFLQVLRNNLSFFCQTQFSFLL